MLYNILLHITLILTCTPLPVTAFHQSRLKFQPPTNTNHRLHAYKHEIQRRDGLKLISGIIPVSTLITPTTTNAITFNEIAQKMRRVPVFALVDGSGNPFTTFQGDGLLGGNAIGYFFLSFEDAQNVLNDAVLKTKEAQTNDKNYDKYIATDWINAKVVTLPLELAFKLLGNHPKSKAQNGNSYDTVYNLIPSTKDIEDAKMVQYSMSKMYNERGRVPLFYSDKFVLPPKDGQTKKRIPVFFTKNDYKRAWENKFPDDPAVPRLMVMELNELFDAVNRGTSTTINMNDLDYYTFVPSAQATKDAKKCVQDGATTYKMGEIVLVKAD